MKFCLVCYILLNACFAVAQAGSSTKGHFFIRIQETGKDEAQNASTVFTKGLFSCERNDSCPYIVKYKTRKSYSHSTENEVIKAKESYSAIWMKKNVIGDCKDIYDVGARASGIYEISLQNKIDPLNVFCDMETDGGGWTVIQRRVNGNTTFNRQWDEYKLGFGRLEKNMWIGLENMHLLAGPDKNTTLRIELKHFRKNETLYAKYGGFKISSEADSYRLHVSKYSGTAGDAFRNAVADKITNGMKFSTIDRDNDLAQGKSCSEEYGGSGWWFNGCFNCNLNSPYPTSPGISDSIMTWKTIDGTFGNIYFSEMKICPNEN